MPSSSRRHRVLRSLLALPLALAAAGCSGGGPMGLSGPLGSPVGGGAPGSDLEMVFVTVAVRVTTSAGAPVPSAPVTVTIGRPVEGGACGRLIAYTPETSAGDADGAFSREYQLIDSNIMFCFVVRVEAPGGSGLKPTSVTTAPVWGSSTRGSVTVRVEVVLSE